MHRVELKVKEAFLSLYRERVPNAPCGVESRGGGNSGGEEEKFLMHRVELKVAAL